MSLVCDSDSSQSESSDHAPGILPACRVKVALNKVVKRSHVFFFSEQDVVGDTLQNLEDNSTTQEHDTLDGSQL